jgi:hypothetical protein
MEDKVTTGSTERQQLREFLLGGLSPEVAEDLEERMFAEAALYQALDEERAALIEEYVEERLPGEDSARFERQRTLSPELAREVEQLRDLRTLLKRRQESAVSSVRSSRFFLRPLPVVMAVCLSLLALAVCVQWKDNRRLRAELAQTAKAPQSVVKAAPVPAGQAQEVLFLAAAVLRGPQDVSNLEITPAASLLELQIEVPAAETTAGPWSVELDREGQEMLRCDTVLARSAGSIHYLPIYIAADSLPAGNYSLHISSRQQGSTDTRKFRLTYTASAVP